VIDSESERERERERREKLPAWYGVSRASTS